jgi:hypothetical protein
MLLNKPNHIKQKLEANIEYLTVLVLNCYSKDMVYKMTLLLNNYVTANGAS